MNIILVILVIAMLTLLFLTGAIWLIGKAIDTFIDKDAHLLPNSIEEACPGTMLVHSNEQGADCTEVIAYIGNTDAFSIEQRAADYLQDDKYTYVEFKDPEGRTYHYDRYKLLRLGWPFPRWILQEMEGI